MPCIVEWKRNSYSLSPTAQDHGSFYLLLSFDSPADQPDLTQLPSLALAITNTCSPCSVFCFTVALCLPLRLLQSGSEACLLFLLGC